MNCTGKEASHTKKLNTEPQAILKCNGMLEGMLSSEQLQHKTSSLLILPTKGNFD